MNTEHQIQEYAKISKLSANQIHTIRTSMFDGIETNNDERRKILQINNKFSR